MNAGYVSLWLLLVVLILNATGWKRVITDDLSWLVILLFAGGWMILSPFHLQIVPYFIVEWTMIWLLFWAVLVIYAHRDRYHATFLLFGAGLITVIWFWIRKMYIMDPVFVFIHPNWDAPFVSGLFAGIMSGRFKDQYAMLALSAGFGEVMVQYIVADGSKLGHIGDGMWWDRWLCALLIARIVGGLAAILIRLRAKLRWGGLHDRGGHSS
ncbi:YphA family membrane protein [Paenibacillus abyssi]|uniref:Uncharacterized protein n=1 Tax=Paenibacillus abyssi TaxID=1340531 RepID=A0A917FLK0_9BACL|nr:hypothetical protein [Paenibacillus abyssi]GGF87780.1 hypothetical protein GCM10010916_01380 [Paenibacillus abyssi]